MGVVNANPDSFSDPGPRSLDTVVARAVELLDEGAVLIDVGAQSAITLRPPIDPAAEAGLVAPAVEAILAARPDAIVSVDTYKPAVVEAVLAAGAHLVNDVSGLGDRAVARACAAYGAGLVVMHTAAPPLTPFPLHGGICRGGYARGALIPRTGRAPVPGLDHCGGRRPPCPQETHRAID